MAHTSSAELQRLLTAAFATLGVRRLVFAIHDVSFPSLASEDVGRGAPGTRASLELLSFVRELGFNAMQLGPQGQTARDNPSPYDGTIFSRNVDSIPLATFESPELRALVGGGLASLAMRGATARADHGRAHDVLHDLVRTAYAAFDRERPAALVERLAQFRSLHREWLDRDALYAAISASHGGAGFRDWGHDLELWAPHPGAEAAHEARKTELARQHGRAIEEYAFAQLVAHEAHAAFRREASERGLALYADLQVGLADSDAWTLRGLLLRSHVMGAPPSRTTPAGQPWNYGVFDPGLYYQDGGDEPGSPPGPVLRFMMARADKTLAEYDSVRIDHPHGFVCPWVYRAGTDDAGRAVREGARLFEAPDLSDHPELARFARVRPEQIDRARPRYADDWVRALEAEQVSRYAAMMSAIVTAAERHGRDPSGIAVEVLSTMPRPLGSVLERLGLGRFRIGQKANLDDPADVYRSENAGPRDWAMLGNHDTPTIWSLARGYAADVRAKWAAHLARRLSLDEPRRLELAQNPGMMVHAMLAELFASRAENVSIFFADLFGYEERYNVPGEVGPHNWSLRLPADFASLYDERAARMAAIDLPLALALALESRGSGDEHRTSLAKALRAASRTAPSAAG